MAQGDATIGFGASNTVTRRSKSSRASSSYWVHKTSAAGSYGAAKWERNQEAVELVKKKIGTLLAACIKAEVRSTVATISPSFSPSAA